MYNHFLSLIGLPQSISAISGYTELSRAISDYLILLMVISGYLRLSLNRSKMSRNIDKFSSTDKYLITFSTFSQDRMLGLNKFLL